MRGKNVYSKNNFKIFNDLLLKDMNWIIFSIKEGFIESNSIIKNSIFSSSNALSLGLLLAKTLKRSTKFIIYSSSMSIVKCLNSTIKKEKQYPYYVLGKQNQKTNEVQWFLTNSNLELIE